MRRRFDPEKLSTPGLHKDSDVPGLYLRVAEGGAKAWAFKFMLNGRAREMGFGSLEIINLSTARSKALAARQLLADGKDPIEARKQERTQHRLDDAKRVTFKDFSGQFIEARKSEWKNDRHQTAWEKSLEKYAYPQIGDLPVAAIDVNAVLKVLEQRVGETTFWRAHSPTASRVRERIELRSGPNPARWKGNL
jgi:hypothetical protein